MSEEMPSWPEPIWYELNGRRGLTTHAPFMSNDVIVYERARADAALARLHRATEFIGHIREVTDNEDDRQDCTDVLSAIGPLPALPTLSPTQTTAATRE